MDFRCAQNYKPHIPPGDYVATCTSCDSKFWLRKTRKLFLNFTILNAPQKLPDGEKTTLFMAFNMPYHGKVCSGSKYYKTWCLVNGRKPPSRNAVMSPKLFLNRTYKVRVSSVRPKDIDSRTEMPPAFHYSKVERILEVLDEEE